MGNVDEFEISPKIGYSAKGKQPSTFAKAIKYGKTHGSQGVYEVIK